MSQTSASPQAAFDAEKSAALHFARVLEKAADPQQLRALLLADTDAPYHDHDILALFTRIEAIGYSLCELMSEDLDEDGAPL